MDLRRSVICVLLLVPLWSCAGVKQPDKSGAPTVVAATPEQLLVTDANGMTVYYFDLDKPNQSTCVDECSTYWFPVKPHGNLSSGKFSVFTRSDGAQQVAYDGRPLYTYHRDRKPGDMKGDGQRGRWHALRY